MNTHKSSICQCPYCSYQVDCATTITDKGPPEPGMFSICINCMNVCVFAEDMSIRKPTLEEIAAVGDMEWGIVQRTIKALKEAKQQWDAKQAAQQNPDAV